MHQARAEHGIGRLALWIGLFVLVGIPLVAYLWETLNQVMAGYFHPLRLALAVPALLVFAGLLRVMSRFVRRWETQRAD